MILGIGVDIVQKTRIKEQLIKYELQLAENVLCESELNEYANVTDKIRYLSNHFAAKEAAAKALGTGMSNGVQFKDICVNHDSMGCPSLNFSGEAKRVLDEKNILHVHLSISDERDYSVAMVVFS